MPMFEFEGRAPKWDPTAFVAPTAVLIGDVTVEAGASVWFNAVLRADYAPVVIREGANVQDGSVLHAPPGIPGRRRPGCHHRAYVHHPRRSCRDGGADREPPHGPRRRGDRRPQPIIAAHPAGGRWNPDPPEVLVTGAPQRSGPHCGTRAEVWVQANPQAYRDLAQRYRTDRRDSGRGSGRLVGTHHPHRVILRTTARRGRVPYARPAPGARRPGPSPGSRPRRSGIIPEAPIGLDDSTPPDGFTGCGHRCPSSPASVSFHPRPRREPQVLQPIGSNQENGT